MAEAEHASSLHAMDDSLSPTTTRSDMDISEAFREREFYRYYQPSDPDLRRPEGSRPPSLPFIPPRDAPEVTGTVAGSDSPVPSRDKALTAFAQLGALRMNARRCMVSFFDRKNHYIMAEATRTLSLQTGIALDPDDVLSWGQTVFPRGNGICDYTVKLPKIEAWTEYGKLDVTSFVVKDLSQDDRFRTKPYVISSPHLRFYVGVPIRSPNGHNIGSYCIMDDKPRDGVSTSELAFMHDMSITVMRHLEMIKMKEHHRRGGDMVRSLGCFSQGKETLEDWWLDPCDPRPSLAKVRSQQRLMPALVHQSSMDVKYGTPGYAADSGMHSRNESVAGQSERQVQTTSMPALSHNSSGETNIEMQEKFLDSGMHSRNASTAATSFADSHLDQGFETLPSLPTVPETPLAKHTLQEEVLAPDVKSTFARAARIVLEATEVDGVVFFDASIGTFGGLVEETLDPEALNETQDWQYDGVTPTVEHSDPLSQGTSPGESGLGEDKPCEVLGCAVKSNDDGYGRQYPMREKILRGLLRHYPRGHIFSFDESGQSFEDISDDQTTPSQYQRGQNPSFKAPMLSSNAATHRQHLAKDEKTLHNMFPEARSLALCPMWDSHRSRWFAGAIIWSTDPMRIFTVEQELSYLTAFGNGVMAEVARLDTTMADQAKADFISSISHELRSPLHGILGCCGMLATTLLDSFQTNMTESIETCGKTLLDTINHVLDFAKINTSKDSKSTNDIMSLVTDVDLSIVAEEVLETVFTGYHFQKSASVPFAPPQGPNVATPNETFNIQHAISKSPAGSLPDSQNSSDHGVAIIVDINKSDSWIFQTQAGAWRRILMNLFGNALKYTDEGFIKVKLQVTPAPSEVMADSSDIRLVVTDSGRGMSPEYIRDRLFHAFAQENPLSQGTGLGLSIVRQIIDSLGGNIDVQSEEKTGTKMTVSCRLKNVLPSAKEAHPLSDVTPDLMNRSNGLKVAFVGFDEMAGLQTPLPSRQHKKGLVSTITRKALETICTDWYGMDVVLWNTTSPDLFIVTELGADILKSRFGSNAGRSSNGRHQEARKPPPIIVICNAVSSGHSNTNTVASTVDEQTIEYVAQPCGPRKLGKALSACLSRHADSLVDRSSENAVAGAEGPPSFMSETMSNLSSLAGALKLDMFSSKVKAPEASSSVQDDIPANMTSSPKTEKTRPPIPQSQSSPQLGSKIKTPIAPPHHVSFNILAVDDNHINLTLLRLWVQRLSHDVITATNGVDAVEKYKARCTTASVGAPADANLSATQPPRFDAVLMDISMPEMDGMEATRLIRAHERELGLKPARIIALTGLASAQAQQEAFSSGIDMFLTKPIQQRELEEVLRDMGGAGEVVE